MSFSTGRCSGFFAGTAVAATASTVTGSLPQSDARGVANKMSGFQPEISLRAGRQPAGRNRFAHLHRKDRTNGAGDYNKVGTASLPADLPSPNDWAASTV